jgi:hypothetical protein
MSEEKVEVAVERVGSKACEDAVRLGDDGVKVSKRSCQRAASGGTGAHAAICSGE